MARGHYYLLVARVDVGVGVAVAIADVDVIIIIVDELSAGISSTSWKPLLECLTKLSFVE